MVNANTNENVYSMCVFLIVWSRRCGCQGGQLSLNYITTQVEKITPEFIIRYSEMAAIKVT